MLEQIKQLFDESTDLFTETLDNGYWPMEIAYFPAMCDERIKDGILIPYSYRFDPDEFRRMLHSNPKYERADNPDEWPNLLLKGYALIKLEETCYSFKSDRTLYTQPDETQLESSLQGPQSAFTEDLELNAYLLRKRYNVPTLSVEPYEKGSLSRTAIFVVYDRKLVNPSVLELLRKRLDKVNIELLQSTGQLIKELTDKNHLFFPTLLQSERPDKVAVMLSRGKVAVLINGSRFALLLPVRLFDFMHAMDDDYESFWISRFLIVMRYVAVLLTIVLPAAYIGIVSYNPEIFRIQLAFTIDGSRAGVPYPSFIEVFIMLFMIEALIEASIRLPKSVGSAATTVGGLILGQAAQQAGLVSSIMIIVTSVVAISNYVIPNHTFSQAIRLMKYWFILISMIYGVSGIAVLFFALIVYLCHLRSFGEPYLAFYGGQNDQKPQSAQRKS
ncbi:spore germination protein [Cohnella endophytica]|uniref:Spore germination protein n=1 Tax=Cohnella endophytica TaxID=2419778 RepID=A0A494XUA1_9BACL|nr:spore germination protein [Cohnella endophytica]RKP54203.1 spore germination protein [Cohnella endophytica]